MVTLPVTPTPARTDSTGGTATSTGTNDGNLGLGTTQLNTQDFISILTAQLKFQDPLNPVDPNQFVGEMAQFGSLNELIGIKQDLDQGLTTPASQGSSATSDTASKQAAGIS